MIKLFVVGFPRDMEESELVELFSAYGQVNSVTIVTDVESGKSQGYGFMVMTDKAGADRAIAAMDGATIDDRTISVRIAEDKKNTTQQVFTTAQGSALNGQRVADQKQSWPEKKKRPRRPM
jgi:RNA recognition motif-containing protein